MKISKKLEWGRFVSPISDRNKAPFNWYSFKHRFGSELVSEIFSTFNLIKGDTVFDPFCGGGTTILQAKLEGYNAVGLDISPFCVFLTNTLASNYNSYGLRKTLKEISHEIDNDVEIPEVALLRKSFSLNSLKYIYSLRNSINLLDSPDKDFFLFALLSILNNIGKAKKTGAFLRITDQRSFPPNLAKKVFIETSEKFIEELNSFNYSNSLVKASLGDARNYPTEIKNMKYDAIVTSPPYPNRHDYTRIYELELLVGFLNDNPSLKLLRYNTLRSHVEAKKRYEVKGYIIPSLLEREVRELKKRKLNNPQIISTLYGYFEDMYLSLEQMSKVLKSKGHIGLVVSNVRYEGVNISVDVILSDIAEQVGLKTKYIYLLRFRSNSQQQLKKYGKSPMRESLIIWQKVK